MEHLNPNNIICSRAYPKESTMTNDFSSQHDELFKKEGHVKLGVRVVSFK